MAIWPPYVNEFDTSRASVIQKAMEFVATKIAQKMKKALTSIAGKRTTRSIVHSMCLWLSA